MKKSILLVLLALPFSLFAQIDTLFWFAAPDVSASHGDEPITINFSTFDEAADIVVSMPADPSFTPLTLSMAANSFDRIVLEYYDRTGSCNKSSIGCGSVHLKDQIEVSEVANSIENKGLLITATSPVTVYYEVLGSQCDEWASGFPTCQIINTDIFALKGQNAFGTEFLIPGQTGHYTVNQDFWGGPNGINGKNTVDIVATEDATITFTLPTGVSAVGHAAGSSWTESLTEGQTITIMAIEDVPASQIWNDLVGLQVSSTGKIAVTYKDDSVADRTDYATNGPGGTGGVTGNGPQVYDLIGDQLIPLELAGREFIVQDGYVYISSATNNTSVTIATSSGTTTQVINSGETIELDLKNDVDPIYITSDEDLQVLHMRVLSGNGGFEFGGAVIPQLKCTGSKRVSFSRSSNEVQEQFLVTIIVRTGGEGDFTLNGDGAKIQATDFVDVPGTGGDWKFANINFNDTDIPVLQTSTVENSTSFFHLGTLNGRPFIDANNNSTGVRYGYFSNFEQFDFGVADVQTCILGDSVDVSLDDQGGDLSFVWQTGDIADTTATLTFRESDTVEVEVTNEIGCVTTASVRVRLTETPEFELPNDTLLCQLDTLVLDFPLDEASLGENTFEWSRNGNPLVAQSDSSLEVYGFYPGTYALTISNDCGSDADSMEISDFPVQIDINDQTNKCEPSHEFTFQVTGGNVPNVIWYNAENPDDTLSTTADFTSSSSGTYIVVGFKEDLVSGKQCFVLDSSTIDFIVAPDVTTSNDTVVCPGEKVELTIETNTVYTTLTWALNDTVFSTSLEDTIITVDEAGKYTVTIDNECGSDPHDIIVGNWVVEVPNIFTPNGDGKNETFVVEEIERGGTWKFEVYNRWGKRVYRNNDYQNEWDGVDQLDQDLASDGVYFFELGEDGDCRYTKGWVTIVK